jgi:hypothetical protein
MAEEWKGIIPGVSTRSDVFRLVEKCNDRLVPCEFEYAGDKIRIIFSGTVQDSFYECAKKLPADTVLLVEVTPRVPINLRRLRESYSLKELGAAAKFAGYVEERAGLILKTYKDEVIQLNYVAAGSDRNRCEDYYSDPIKFVQVVTHCPPITVEAPTPPVIAGDKAELKVNAQPDPKMTLFWWAYGAKIVDQVGNRLILDTSGLDGYNITVSVQARGSCSTESAVTFTIRPSRLQVIR